MRKEEIKFLMDAGYTLAEIMTMGTQDREPEAVELVEDPEPIEQSQEEQPEEPATEAKPDKTTEALSQAIADLQKTVDKLGARIAAQGVKATAHEAPGPESIDSRLSKIAKKINGG